MKKKIFSMIACGMLAIQASAALPEGFMGADPAPVAPDNSGKVSTKETVATKHSDNWKSLGKGRYTEDFITTMFNVPNYTWEVEYQENVDEPGVYRIVNPYGEGCPYTKGKEKNFNIVINASNPNRVYVETVQTDLDLGYGPITFSSWAAYWMEKDGVGPDQVGDTYFGVLRDGVFVFPFKYLLVKMRDYIDNSAFYANCNRQGIFRLPGSKDYDLSITHNYCPEDPKAAVLEYKTSTDFYKVNYIFKKAYDGTNYYGMNEKSFVQAMQEGKELQQGEGKLSFDLTKEGRGKYICYMAAFTADSTIMARATTDFFFDDDNPDEWEKVGNSKYTEDFFSNVVGTNPKSWNVETERNKKDGNFYRLVNPYKDFNPMENTVHETAHNHYIYLHLDKIGQEDVAYIEESLLGIDVERGPVKVTSTPMLYNMYGNSWSVIRNFHLQIPLFGSYDKDRRKVTFQKEYVWISMPRRQGGEYLPTNSKGKLAIVLPEASGVDEITSESQEQNAEYFTISGLKVSGSDLAPGIYIRRIGDKVEKIAISK